jgi:hypothetical protein
LKHGVFAINPAIPGEDPREFEALHSALIDEWKPSGPTEEEAVYDLADAMWHKLRGQKFRQASLIRFSCDFSKVVWLLIFCQELRSAPETAFAEDANTYLNAWQIDHLNQCCPRSNYTSAEQWAEALRNEIRTGLVPLCLNTELDLASEIDCLPEEFRKDAMELRLILAVGWGRNSFEHGLDQCDRLNARIVRTVKHLVQTKAMKQMLRQTSTDH